MSSKGITPVIATVLLITISIGATGAAYTYIINAQDTAAQNFEEQLTDTQVRQQTNLNIEHIYRSGNDFAFLIVRNTGSIDQQIQSEGGQKYWTLYVDGKPAGTDGTGWLYLSSPPPGEFRLEPSKTIAINSTKSFPSSGEKDFKLVGKYGSTDTYICFGSSTGNSC